MMGELSVEKILSEFVGLLLLIMIPPLICTHQPQPPKLSDVHDQAAHYHIIGLQVGENCLMILVVYKPEQAS
jgi:hypothetical protein